MRSVRTALIVGGGIAGPACALAFARVGIRSTIVEAHPGPADGVGAIITLASNGFEVLQTLRADEAVAAEAQITSQVQMSDGAGHPFARYPGGGRVLARDSLARILAHRAAQTGSSIQYGRQLTDVQARSDGVTAKFVDGDTLEADLVVGADGIHSIVRTLIDSDAPGPMYEGVLGFGAATDSDFVPAELGVMNFAFGERFLGYWRLPDGRIGWYAALPHSEKLDWTQVTAVPRAEWLSRLRAEYAGHVPADELLTRTPPGELISTGPMLRMPPLPHWFGDRTVLVGDSAHAPSSSSGQGASLALESAVELARCLRDIPDLSLAFATYASLRRPRVEAISAAAAVANRSKAGKPTNTPVERLDPADHHIDFDATATATDDSRR
jgi:2-polyprenyl-6-methoxyphenol hydroxylase-like FAD-dependent oxidoreductase